jgi:DNA-binding LytR/AlgR family response regulator
LEKLKLENEKRKNAFLEITSNRKLARIPYNEIIYIESLADYIKVYTEKLGEIVSKEKISVIGEKLPNDFLRIHRSFIVNIKRITRFNSNEVELNNTQLNIGRSYKKQVLIKLKS